LMNSIVRDNSYTGSNIYSGPFELFMVHNVFDNNGTPGDLYNKSSLIITPNHVTYPNQDQNPIIAYLYNNIFYKSNAETSLLNKYWRISTVPPNYSTDLTINSDYNAWIQRDNEAFCLLGAYNGSQEASTFKYGANGPGNSSGNWYEWYGGSKNVPTAGTGHYHQDSHSYASGGANPSVPSFYDISNHNYVLTAAYPGINLLSMPWYIPEMGQDSRGVNRSSWDLGPLDFNLSIISPTNLRLVGP